MPTLELEFDQWQMRQPFVTASETTTHIRTLTVCLADRGLRGRGEALGVDYLGEDAASMAAQVTALRGELERGVDARDLLALLPPGGARNAVDCALWDLRAKQSGRRAWELLGMTVQPVHTLFTLGLGSAADMAAEAAKRSRYPVLKLKLDGNGTAQKLRAIREARPDAELVIDANGSWSAALLDSLADVLVECRVGMLEQPLPRGADQALAGLEYPVPLCADESCQSSAELEAAAALYDMVNIKLDKCGGLTEALAMADWCRRHGIPLMVGNMLGSSLAMAPAFVVAQACRFVDLDGPLWQRSDRAHALHYDASLMQAPEAPLWG